MREIYMSVLVRSYHKGFYMTLGRMLTILESWGYCLGKFIAYIGHANVLERNAVCLQFLATVCDDCLENSSHSPGAITNEGAK